MAAPRVTRFLAAAIFTLLPCMVSSEDAPSASTAIILNITGAIGPATAEYVHNAVGAAEKRGARVIVLQMDTPGGLSSSMREIVHNILASPIPLIGYVSPNGARAASAGTYIMYACHLAAMAPSTHLGAATPVQIGASLFGGGKKEKNNEKKNGENKTVKASANPSQTKTLNDAIAYIRSLAQLRGRNAEWAEKAVREAATLTASEARNLQVVDLVADNIPDLLHKIDGRAVKINNQDISLKTAGLKTIAVEPDWRSRMLSVITNPNIAYLLLLAGIYGIMFEFISPGAYFPGVLGGIMLLTGLYALNLLPVNFAGAGLLLLGMAMMVGEIFVPSGVLAVGGVVSFALGSLFLYHDVPGFALSWQVVATATLISLGFLAVVLAAVVRAHRRKVVIDDAMLSGREAHVLSWNGDEGEVQAWGERWRAQSAAKLSPGQRVRVVERRDLTLYIEPETAALPNHTLSKS